MITTSYDIEGNVKSYCTTSFLIDRDSCSDIVGYLYDVDPRWMYKGKLAQLLIYSLG